jgi:hypothetical protein
MMTQAELIAQLQSYGAGVSPSLINQTIGLVNILFAAGTQNDTSVEITEAPMPGVNPQSITIKWYAPGVVLTTKVESRAE